MYLRLVRDARPVVRRDGEGALRHYVVEDLAARNVRLRGGCAALELLDDAAPFGGDAPAPDAIERQHTSVFADVPEREQVGDAARGEARRGVFALAVEFDRRVPVSRRTVLRRDLSESPHLDLEPLASCSGQRLRQNLSVGEQPCAKLRVVDVLHGEAVRDREGRGSAGCLPQGEEDRLHAYRAVGHVGGGDADGDEQVCAFAALRDYRPVVDSVQPKALVRHLAPVHEAREPRADLHVALVVDAAVGTHVAAAVVGIHLV